MSIVEIGADKEEGSHHSPAPTPRNRRERRRADARHRHRNGDDQAATSQPVNHDFAHDPNYWDGLIAEDLASDFLDLTDRTMQKLRQVGGGPPFIRLSARCIRYRRRDLKQWADERLRRSTSDPGAAAAEHAVPGD